MGFFENVNKDFSLWIQSAGLSLIQAAAVLIIGWWLINRINKVVVIFFQKTNTDEGMVSFLNSVLKFALRIILLAIVLSCLGLNVTSIFAAIGAFLIAIGIALKDNLSNLISGIMLVINQPIHIGDYIEFENVKGTVIKIEMLFTTLQTQEEDKIVIVPNSRLIANNITRESRYNMSQIRVNYKLQSIEEMQNLSETVKMELILQNHVLQIPAPEVEINKNDDGTISLNINIWCEKQFEENAKNGLNVLKSKMIHKYNLEILES